MNFFGTKVDSKKIMASIKSIIISKQFGNAFKLLYDIKQFLTNMISRCLVR